MHSNNKTSLVILPALVINIEIVKISIDFLADWDKDLHNSFFCHNYNL